MYFIVPCLVIFSFHPRRAPQCRHVTKIPSPQLLLFPPLANRDARNSFRFRSYANCRVTSFKPKAFSLFEPFPSGPSNLPTFFLSDLLSATPSESPPRSAQFCWYLSPFRMKTSKSVSKQRTLTTFRMNTYEKQGEGGQLLLTRNAYLFPSVASLLPTPSFLTSHGIITCRKITGSGHTFTCRPRCPPCGLIHASFGTSPLLRIKYASDTGTCVSSAPVTINIGAVGFPRSCCSTRDNLGNRATMSSPLLTPAMTDINAGAWSNRHSLFPNMEFSMYSF